MRARILFLQSLVVVLAFALAGARLASAQGVSTASTSFELYIDEIYNKRQGGEIEFSVAFRDTLTREVNPTLRVNAGDRVTIRLINRTQRPRSFAIMGVKDATAPTIAAGGRTTLQFLAPARGNYIYRDPGQASLAEPRTLFGDFVVGATSH